jgi:hypothetical protein
VTSKEEKFFSNTKWYHGTMLTEWKSICETGVSAKYNIGISLDFGNGFYLSNSQTDAENYALNAVKYGNSSNKNEQPIVLCFEFSPMDMIENGSSYHYFGAYDDEFANFVFDCRENYLEAKRHSYDITGGVMTDYIPTKLMQQYFLGELSRQDVVELLKKTTSKKQICLHKQEDCDTIKLISAYIIGGKELDVNEYNKRF